MDKAIDKGNLIDFFAVLIPGMVIVVLSIAMNLEHINPPSKINKELMTSIVIFILFLIASYLSGLLLMELAVILQKLFPSFFDYYRGAIKKEALRDDGSVLFEFMIFHVPVKNFAIVTTPQYVRRLIQKIENKKNEYENMEYWLLTHNYSDLIERKKAYRMMNRSLATVPIAYLIVQVYTVHVIKAGGWPTFWKISLVIALALLMHYRARRQAFLFFHEVSKIYEFSRRKYLELDKM